MFRHSIVLAWGQFMTAFLFSSLWVELAGCNASLTDLTTKVIPASLARLGLLLGGTNSEVGQGSWSAMIHQPKHVHASYGSLIVRLNSVFILSKVTTRKSSVIITTNQWRSPNKSYIWMQEKKNKQTNKSLPWVIQNILKSLNWYSRCRKETDNFRQKSECLLS